MFVNRSLQLGLQPIAAYIFEWIIKGLQNQKGKR